MADSTKVKKWFCRECSSNSTMPKEHGCDACQDFVNTNFEGRIYEGTKEYDE